GRCGVVSGDRDRHGLHFPGAGARGGGPVGAGPVLLAAAGVATNGAPCPPPGGRGAPFSCFKAKARFRGARIIPGPARKTVRVPYRSLPRSIGAGHAHATGRNRRATRRCPFSASSA